jgi:hypothetical protein
MFLHGVEGDNFTFQPEANVSHNFVVVLHNGT